MALSNDKSLFIYFDHCQLANLYSSLILHPTKLCPTKVASKSYQFSHYKSIILTNESVYL